MGGNLARTVVDHWSWHSQIIEPDFTLTGKKVVAAIVRAAKQCGYPKIITEDNGSEFTLKALDAWAYAHEVKLDVIRPGKPVEHRVIEGFNGRSRDECLTTNVFVSLRDARQKVERWQIDYSERRPHGSLGHYALQAFVEQQLNPGCRKHRISSNAWSSF